ncbi:MAG: AhpC/TSA family protein [Prevotella sp.]|nr:AhpC/TSA family protein [Prevotella sp.]
MKNRITTLIMALLAMTVANAQTSSQKMHDLLTAFGESGEHHVQKASENDNKRSFYFSEVWVSNLAEIPKENAEKIFHPHLSTFFKAFSDYAGDALEVYYHDAPESDPMMPGLKVTWTGKEGNWSEGIQMPIKPSENVRLILFKEPDDQRRLFIMTWEQSIRYDSETEADFITTHGKIEEYVGYKSKHEPFVAPYQRKEETPLPNVATTMATTYDELQAKVHRTCEIFKGDTQNGRNAAAVVLHRLSESYPGQLTDSQYYALLEEIQPLIDKTDDKGLKQLLGYTCYTLYQKSDIYIQPDSIPEQGHISTATITMMQFSKLIRYETTMMSHGKPMTFKVKGRTAKDVKTIGLMRYPQHEDLGDYPVKNGQFELTLTLPKDEIVQLYTSGDTQEIQAFFCIDEQPLTIDLVKNTVKGSPQNQLLHDSLPTIWEAKKEKRMDILQQMMHDNRSNLLSAFAIMEMYSEMSLDELKPWLGEDYAYSQHPMLVPARQYAEGLEKRSIGKPCPNAELVDTDNIVQQLHSYTKGNPALIHFWDSNICCLEQVKRLRALHKQYPYLRIVSIAIGQYPKEWRRLIEKEEMEWTNLLAADGWKDSVVRDFGICSLPETVIIGKDGSIVATPKNMDDLEEILIEFDSNP